MRAIYNCDGAATQGSSTQNTRVESMWVPVNRVTEATKFVMYGLVEDGWINVDQPSSLLTAQIFFSA